MCAAQGWAVDLMWVAGTPQLPFEVPFVGVIPLAFAARPRPRQAKCSAQRNDLITPRHDLKII
jgi:hypothetical protein